MGGAGRSDMLAWSVPAPEPEAPAWGGQWRSADGAETTPGGFWRRFVALLVDLLLVRMLVMIGGLLAALLSPWEVASRAFGYTYVLVVPAAYFVLMHGTGGQTLGKMVSGVRVVALTGEPLGYLRALLRAAAWLLSVASLLAGFLLVALRPDRRALHDLLAGTRVTLAR